VPGSGEDQRAIGSALNASVITPITPAASLLPAVLMLDVIPNH